MLYEYLTDPAWLAVFLALLALVPQLVVLGRWLWKRWRAPYVPRTQVQEDRRNYGLLLQQYESYLDLLENLLIVRSQHEAGPDEWTPELEQAFTETRDGIFNSLEKRSDREDDMGVFQKLGILEGRLVSISEQRKRRAELQTRQREIEKHRLFMKRTPPVA